MTVLLVEGFDDYNSKTDVNVGMASGGWTISGNTAGSFITGRFGVGRALRINNPTITALNDRFDLGANYASIACGVAVRAEEIGADWGTAGSGEPLFGFLDSGAAKQFDISLDSQGDLVFKRGGSTVIATSDGTHRLRSTIWSYVEIEVTIDDSSGTVKMWIDGIQVCNVSGADTETGGTGIVREFTICPTNGLDSAVDLDDLYITDGTRLGECQVVDLAPTSDGSPNTWVASTGTDEFAMVDESPANSDTDYIQTSTAGDKSFFGLSDLAAQFDTVHAVGVMAWMRKTDGTARSARGKIRSNTDEGDAATLTLTTSYLTSYGLFNTDPQGGGAWTPTRVNALESGVEVVS